MTGDQTYKCHRCQNDCQCEDGAFIYRDFNGRSVFTGIVRKTKPDGSQGLFKLHDPFGTLHSPSTELEPKPFMIDMTVYDNCTWPSAPNRTKDLVRMEFCNCEDPNTCRNHFLPKNNDYDEAFPFSQDDQGRWHVNVRPGDEVKLSTNVMVPNSNFPVQERFWAIVLAVHTLGLNDTEPRITVQPCIRKWFHIKKKQWNPKDPLVCDVSCVSAVAHGCAWD